MGWAIYSMAYTEAKSVSKIGGGGYHRLNYYVLSLAAAYKSWLLFF